jgi:hypothetical protein
VTRAHIALLLALVVIVPAAAAGTFFASSPSPEPCFVEGTAAYRISGSASASYTVRIDNEAANPSLRMQLVDDPAAADFVLVDDSDAGEGCQAASGVKSIRIDPAAQTPDLTVALSQAPANYKIYVKSASFSEQDAAALFAVIWQNSRKSGLGREFAKRD